MKSDFSVSFERRLGFSFQRRLRAFLLLLLSLLPLQCTSERASPSYSQLIFGSGDDVLPWHRLPDCPSDETNFVFERKTGKCLRQFIRTKGVVTSAEYKCIDFTQYCFNRTIIIHCDVYERKCTKPRVIRKGDTEAPTCTELYNCTVSYTGDNTTLITQAPGIPAKVYADQCIPAVDALRDQCNSTFTCITAFSYNTRRDDLLGCTIHCVEPENISNPGTSMQCYNYTRDCTFECTSERAYPSYNQLIFGSGDDILPWHRLPDCPSDETNFVFERKTGKCLRQFIWTKSVVTSAEYKCIDFTQYCFNKTMKIHCDVYERNCTNGDTEAPNCTERYNCTVSYTGDNTTLITKAPGVPAKVYAECIPVVDALRDQCNSTFTCITAFSYNTSRDDLLGCAIHCVEPENISNPATSMQCYNYTRDCTFEESEVVNWSNATVQTVKIIDAECVVTTRERRLDEHMIWNDTKIGEKEDGEDILEGAMIVNRTEYFEWNQEMSWDKCTADTQVPYQPICNQFIRHMMEPLKDVVYDPRAYDIINGIKTFMSLWDDGYEILCGIKVNCFVQLIKFSRTCWPGLPLQRFLPGADYTILEDLMKNMTRIACRTTPPPPVKYEGDEAYLNDGYSCAAFFDVEHFITAPYYKNVTEYCDERKGDKMCEDSLCTDALDGLVKRFGCCMGSIIYEYNISNKWYAHFNFGNNELIRKIETCGILIGEPCELIDPTSIVVTIVRNFIYILGSIMALVVIMMTVSFYWQLEHEPIKKAFYHF